MSALGEFFDSKVFSDLKDGKLPEMDVNVSIRSESLVDLFAGAFFTAVAVLLVAYLIRQMK
jgi:hypothetical protein